MVIKSFTVYQNLTMNQIYKTYEGYIKFDISCKIRFINDFIIGKWSSAIRFLLYQSQIKLCKWEVFYSDTMYIYNIYIYYM